MAPQKRSDKDKVECLPPNFVFSSDDSFYYGPSSCQFFHYRASAVVAAGIELSVQMGAVAVAYYLSTQLESLSYSVFTFLLLFTAFSAAASLLMFYALHSENPMLMRMKLIQQQLQIGFLLILACLSIIAMCFGIELTNHLFGLVLKVEEIERDFGPIWPFNISVLAFMAAALEIWTHIVTGGANEYLLDKAYFASSNECNNVPMEEKRPHED